MDPNASNCKLTNQFRDDGQIIPFAVVPFVDGSDPVANVCQTQVQHLYALYVLIV
jgi:hypothetical protein